MDAENALVGIPPSSGSCRGDVRDTVSDDVDLPLQQLADAALAGDPYPASLPPIDSSSSYSGSSVPSRVLEGKALVGFRRRRDATATPAQDLVAEVNDDSETSMESVSASSYETDSVADSPGSVLGGRRGQPGGVGRGRGRGGRGGRYGGERNAGQHHETDTHITRHNVTWQKDEGRQIDPMVHSGYSAPPRFTLYGYQEKKEVDYFSHVFPRDMVQSLAEATTVTARTKLKRFGWSVDVGEMYVFLGLKMYMMIYPQQGGVSQYWESEDSGLSHRVSVDHSLGKHGMLLSRYREIERCFTLPHRGDLTDPFDPIRMFVERWNQNMSEAFKPSWVIVVDESMGKWQGKGMPALMTVPRKPTPVGREAHTTACGETGVIIFYEPYEGKSRMAMAEFVELAGKNPAKALRCTKPWHGTGRLVILDSGFASVSCAKHLADKGLFMIGNVKTADTAFPKAWLLSKVPRRGMTATCTTTVTTPGGLQLHLLGAADMDRQPMALLGSAGTSLPGRTLHRHFTTIRADGTYNVRDATLEQMHIHELYRKFFNALDKHNSIRQGGHCFEDSWKTQSWYVRDFQMLWGISEVNAWLIYRRFKNSQADTSFAAFRRALCWQLLNHPCWLAERQRARALRGFGSRNVVEGDPHPLVPIGRSDSGYAIQKTCVFCGHITTWNCMCKVDEKTGHGVYICHSSKRDCASQHRAGHVPENRKANAQKRRWDQFRRVKRTRVRGGLDQSN